MPGKRLFGTLIFIFEHLRFKETFSFFSGPSFAWGGGRSKIPGPAPAHYREIVVGTTDKENLETSSNPKMP